MQWSLINAPNECSFESLLSQASTLSRVRHAGSGWRIAAAARHLERRRFAAVVAVCGRLLWMGMTLDALQSLRGRRAMLQRDGRLWSPRSTGCGSASAARHMAATIACSEVERSSEPTLQAVCAHPRLPFRPLGAPMPGQALDALFTAGTLLFCNGHHARVSSPPRERSISR